jgi:hypothetical protein
MKFVHALPAWEAMERAITFQEARRGQLPPSMAQRYPRECELAKQMLSSDPNDRPNIWQIMRHLELMWYHDGIKGEAKASVSVGYGQAYGGSLQAVEPAVSAVQATVVEEIGSDDYTSSSGAGTKMDQGQVLTGTTCLSSEPSVGTISKPSEMEDLPLLHSSMSMSLASSASLFLHDSSEQTGSMKELNKEDSKQREPTIRLCDSKSEKETHRNLEPILNHESAEPLIYKGQACSALDLLRMLHERDDLVEALKLEVQTLRNKFLDSAT